MSLSATESLDGTGSTDPERDPLTYSWTQTSGTPTLTLTGATTATPSFTAPSTISKTADFVFTLTVSDSTLSDTDTVTITIGDKHHHRLYHTTTCCSSLDKPTTPSSPKNGPSTTPDPAPSPSTPTPIRGSCAAVRA